MVFNSNHPTGWKASFLFKGIQLLNRWKGFILINVVVSTIILILVASGQINTPKSVQLQNENENYQKRLLVLGQKVNGMSSKLTAIVGRDDSLYRVVYEASPIPYEQRMVGYGGADRYADLLGYENSNAIINVATKLDQLARQLYVENKSLNEVVQKAGVITQQLASLPAILPVSVDDFNYISSPFGYRNHPKNGHWKRHDGIDIVAPYGAPVYATGNGIVKVNRPSMRGYGKVIMIDHGFGYETLYAHLSKRAVKPYDSVKRGQLLGYVGNTGISTGTHLHYEIIKNGRQINPTKYFSDDLTSWDYKTIIRAAIK